MSGQDILNNLNVVSEKLFKNIEGKAYEILDDIICIDDKILKSEPLSVFIKDDKIEMISTIARTLVMIYVIYYMFLQIASVYNGNSSENVFVFIIKLVVISLFINNSYFICETILNIFELITNCIDDMLFKIIGKEISFVSLRETILSIDDFMKSEFLSVDGLIKSSLAFGIINILINFSIRYVKIIFLVLISPFSFCFLASDLTKGIFDSWIKLLIVNLSLQIFIKIIIAIPLMYKDINTIMFKIVLLGTIYIIYKLNDFTNSIMQNITFFKKR